MTKLIGKPWTSHDFRTVIKAIWKLMNHVTVDLNKEEQSSK